MHAITQILEVQKYENILGEEVFVFDFWVFLLMSLFFREIWSAYVHGEDIFGMISSYSAWAVKWLVLPVRNDEGIDSKPAGDGVVTDLRK